MTCPIWIAIYRPKYLNSKIIRVASTTTGLVNIVKRVNLLLIWLKISRAVNVFLSLTYWKRYLGKTLNYCISFLILLMNLSSSSLHN